MGFFIEKFFELDTKPRLPPCLSPVSDNLLDSLDLEVIPGADLIPKAKPSPAPERKPKAKRAAMVKRVPVPDVVDCPPPTMTGEGGDSTRENRPAEMAKEGPKLPVRVKSKVKEKSPAKSQSKRGNQAGELRGESGKQKEEVEIRLPKLPRDIPESLLKKAIRACGLGMPMERIAGMLGFPDSAGSWMRYLDKNPTFAADLARAKHEGEADLLLAVDDSIPGWQSKAWLLERARGYSIRASLEHTGKGGSQLSIAHEVVGMLGGKEVG